jgi:hypothetical protein
MPVRFPLLFSATLAVATAAAAVPRDDRPEPLRAFGKADGTVVVAMSPVCPCSRSHEATLEALARRFPTFGFVGLRAGDGAADTYFSTRKLAFPVVARPGVARALGALKTPHVFVYDGAGTLRYRGGVDDSHDAARATKPYLADTLGALSRGEPVPVAETRPLGCRVDWD